MRQRHSNSVGLFASLIVLVTVTMQSANGAPISALKRQEIVLNFSDTASGSGSAMNKADDKLESNNFDAAKLKPKEDASSITGYVVQSPHIGKLLVTPAAFAIARDPMASWSGPMIGAGKFHPMPLVPQLGEAKNEEEKNESGAKSTEIAKDSVENTVASDVKQDSKMEPSMTPPDADKVKDITAALAKAEAQSKAMEATKNVKPADAKVEKPVEGKFVKTDGPADAKNVKPAEDGISTTQNDVKDKKVVEAEASKTDKPADAETDKPAKGETVTAKKESEAQANKDGPMDTKIEKPAASDTAKAETSTQTRRSVVLQKRASSRKAKPFVRRRDLPNFQPRAERGTNELTQCNEDEGVQTFVPITYTELSLIKVGAYKVQRTDAKGNNTYSNKTEASCVGVEGEIVLVPISEEAMTALQHGLVQLKSTGTADTVILESAKEASLEEQTTNTNDKAEGATSEIAQDTQVSEAGPMYSVVPAEKSEAGESKTSENQLRIKLRDFADMSNGNSRKRAMINRRHFTIVHVEHAGPAIIKRSLAEYFPVLDKRIKSSSAGNTSLFGNGDGKLKYGHKIHYNAGVSDLSPYSVSTSALFVMIVTLVLALHVQL